MILADTSVWVEHFRHRLPSLSEHLAQGQIATHSVVLGELATGNLWQRTETLRSLQRLPRVAEPGAAECLAFIEQHKLFGTGIGGNDVQLLTAADHSRIPLWSMDKKLARAARRLRVA